MEFEKPFEGYNFFTQNNFLEAIYDGENWNITMIMKQTRSPDINVKTEDEEIELSITNPSYQKALSEILLTVGYWMEQSEGSLFKLKELMKPDEGAVVQ